MISISSSASSISITSFVAASSPAYSKIAPANNNIRTAKVFSIIYFLSGMDNSCVAAIPMESEYGLTTIRIIYITVSSLQAAAGLPSG